jgi:ABC-type transporter Mla MlaB component
MPSLVFAPPLAHLGHWYVSLPVFGGPVLALAIALKIQTWREARKGPDQTGKRSTVSHSRTSDGQTTISVSGSLDYPALLELDIELGKAAGEASQIILDLSQLTTANQEAAAGLCDAITNAHAAERIRVLPPPGPTGQTLGAVLTSEGVRLLQAPGATARSIEDA